MLIGELSKRSGLTRDAIRFYEKHGLIAKGSQKAKFNTYKNYPDETLQRLLSVKRIKGFGFTLNEVADLLDMMDANEASCNNVSAKIEEKISLVDEKINALLALKAQLTKAVQNCRGTCAPVNEGENCPVLTSL